MKKEPLFVALSNQKGGVGKSTFTVLLASYFHYLKGYNVLVVDCDYPQHSISTMRNWEVGNIEKNVHLQNQLVEQFGASGRKAYSILNSTPEEAAAFVSHFYESSGCGDAEISRSDEYHAFRGHRHPGAAERGGGRDDVIAENLC